MQTQLESPEVSDLFVLAGNFRYAISVIGADQ